eukprot:48568-Eustigmatos_ZCMA.PRE.1
MATHNGHHEAVLYMLREPFTPAMLTIHERNTHPLLHEASRRGWGDVVMAMLEHGTQIDTVDSGGHTALQWAVYLDVSNIVAILLEAGADPTLRTSHGTGETSFDIANRHGGRVKKVMDQYQKAYLLRKAKRMTQVKT